MKQVNLLEIFSEKSVHDFVESLLKATPNITLKIVPPRSTKYGTMAFSHLQQRYIITLNSDLSPMFRFYVFLHEFAHLITHKHHKKREKPHGKVWQQHFFELLKQAIDKELFPESVKQTIIQQLLNDSIYSKQRDFAVKQSMMQLSTNNTIPIYLKDLAQNQTFIAFNRTFQVVKKLRTRLVCKDLYNHKQYLISGYLPVKLTEINQYKL